MFVSYNMYDISYKSLKVEFDTSPLPQHLFCQYSALPHKRKVVITASKHEWRKQNRRWVVFLVDLPLPFLYIHLIISEGDFGNARAHRHSRLREPEISSPRIARLFIEAAEYPVRLAAGMNGRIMNCAPGGARLANKVFPVPRLIPRRGNPRNRLRRG